MLHTAAPSVMLTDSARGRLKAIAVKGAVDSVESWGGSTNSRATGNLRWYNLTVWND